MGWKRKLALRVALWMEAYCVASMTAKGYASSQQEAITLLDAFVSHRTGNPNWREQLHDGQHD